MTQEKHKSERSVPRLFGQSVDANGVVIGTPIEVRIAHPFVHEKRKKSAGNEPLDNPRYDMVVLVPKLNRDAAQCPNYKLISDMAIEAATKKWGSFPQGGKWPVQDGDIPHPQKVKPGQTPLTPEQIAAKNKWREGSWIIEVTNYTDIGPKATVLQNGVAVEIPAKIIGGVEQYKSGDYGYVFMNAYTFHNKTFGVNFGFEGVMFTRPGERIGGGGPKSASQMFGSVAAVGGPAPLPPQVQSYINQGMSPTMAAAQYGADTMPPQPAAPVGPPLPAVQQYAPPPPAAAPMPPTGAPAAPMPGQSAMPPLPPMPGR